MVYRNMLLCDNDLFLQGVSFKRAKIYVSNLKSNTFLAKARPHWSQAWREKFLVTLTSVDDPVLLLSSCRRVCGVWLPGDVLVVEEEELRWCMCFSLRRVSGGLTGR